MSEGGGDGGRGGGQVGARKRPSCQRRVGAATRPDAPEGHRRRPADLLSGGRRRSARRGRPGAGEGGAAAAVVVEGTPPPPPKYPSLLGRRRRGRSAHRDAHPPLKITMTISFMWWWWGGGGAVVQRRQSLPAWRDTAQPSRPFPFWAGCARARCGWQVAPALAVGRLRQRLLWGWRPRSL